MKNSETDRKQVGYKFHILLWLNTKIDIVSYLSLTEEYCVVEMTWYDRHITHNTMYHSYKVFKNHFYWLQKMSKFVTLL